MPRTSSISIMAMREFKEQAHTRDADEWALRLGVTRRRVLMIAADNGVRVKPKMRGRPPGTHRPLNRLTVAGWR